MHLQDPSTYCEHESRWVSHSKSKRFLRVFLVNKASGLRGSSRTSVPRILRSVGMFIPGPGLGANLKNYPTRVNPFYPPNS